MRQLRHLLLPPLAAALALVLAAPPASAAPPPGDEVSSAMVVHALPARLSVDTAQATSNPVTDPQNTSCMGGQSVWFRFRPTRDVSVRVHATTPSFTSVVGVFTGTSRSLTPVACNTGVFIDGVSGSGVELGLTAGTTYFLAVSTCCGLDATGGGPVVLEVTEHRLFTSAVRITSTAAGDVSGQAVVSGTAWCSDSASQFSVDVALSQRLGARVARGGAGTGDFCGPARRPWSLRVDSRTGLAFRPGPAFLLLTRSAFDGFVFTSTTTSTVVTLGAAPTAAGG